MNNSVFRAIFSKKDLELFSRKWWEYKIRNSCSLSEHCPSYAGDKKKPMKKHICGAALSDGIGLHGCPLLQYFPTLRLDGVPSLKSNFIGVHFTTHMQMGHGVWLKGVSMPWAQVHISPPLPLPPELISLVLAASSQTPFSSHNPLSTSSPPPDSLFQLRLFPFHSCLIFQAAAGASRDPRDGTQASCPTHWESPD